MNLKEKHYLCLRKSKNKQEGLFTQGAAVQGVPTLFSFPRDPQNTACRSGLPSAPT